MDRTEFMLGQLARECAEVSADCNVALQFGPRNVVPGTDNLTRLGVVGQRVGGLLRVIEMMEDEQMLAVEDFAEEERLTLEKMFSVNAQYQFAQEERVQ